jgi:hypothetical protein
MVPLFFRMLYDGHVHVHVDLNRRHGSQQEDFLTKEIMLVIGPYNVHVDDIFHIFLPRKPNYLGNRGIHKISVFFPAS